MSSSSSGSQTVTVTTQATTTKTTPAIFWQPTGNIVTKPISEQLGFLAVDNSGSTGGSILNDQNQTTKLFGNNLTNKMVLWNSTCSLVKSHSGHTWRSSGGTNPVVIFNQQSNPILSSANVFGIWTDGQIPNHTVPLVHAEASKHICHMTSISVITISRNLENNVIKAFNMSVMAPFRDLCADAILLVRVINDPDDRIAHCPVFRVIQTKGAFAQNWQSPDITTQTRLSQLQYVTAQELLAVNTTVRERPPPNFLPFGNQYINLTAVVHGVELSDSEIVTLLEDPVKLTQMAQSAGLLTELRKRILVMERQLTTWAKTEAERQLQIKIADKFGTTPNLNQGGAGVAPAVQPEMSEMNLMRQLQAMKDQKETSEFKRIQSQLQKIRQLRTQSQIEYNRIYKQLAGDLINKTQTVLAVIGEAERAGYGVDALTRLNQTNRALRSKTVDVSTVDNIVFNDQGALVGECSICCEESGPNTGVVLCLRVKRLSADQADQNIRKKNPDQSPALGDAIQTMPLAFGASSHNQIFLPDEPMCINCAKTYNLSVMTREEVHVIIPCIALDTTQARNIMLDHISIAIADGKVMGPWWQLFVAVLDHNLTQTAFCDQSHPEMHQAMEYLLKQILFNVKTAQTLQEGCTEMVPLMDAINNVIAGQPTNDSPQTPYIQKYFFNGVACMLSLMRFSQANLPDGGFKILHFGLTKQLVISHLSAIKNNNDNIQPLRLALYEKLFTCRYGVPVAGTARLISLEVLFNSFPKSIQQVVKNWCQSQGQPLSDFIQTPAMTLVWWHLVHLGNHDRPDNFIDNIRSQDPLVNACFDDPKSLTTASQTGGVGDWTNQMVIDYLNKKFTRDQIDANHINIKFASAVGPSKLHCVCGYQFLPLTMRQNSLTNKTSLIAMANTVKQRRTKHFKEVYHANEYGNPSQQSTHYNIHKAVQRTFNPDLSDAENQQLAIKYVVKDDRRGYINCPMMESEVMCAIVSFRPFADEWKKAFGADAQPSLEEMIKWEIEHTD